MGWGNKDLIARIVFSARWDANFSLLSLLKIVKLKGTLNKVGGAKNFLVGRYVMLGR